MLLAVMSVGLVVLATAAAAMGMLLASIVMGGGNALRGPAMQACVDAGRAGGHAATAGAFRAIGRLGSTPDGVRSTA